MCEGGHVHPKVIHPKVTLREQLCEQAWSRIPYNSLLKNRLRPLTLVSGPP